MGTVLEKIQKLSLGTRKIILITLVVVLGIVLFRFWMMYFSKKIEEIKKEEFEEFESPGIREKLERDLPRINIPTNLENIKDINMPDVSGSETE